MASSIYKEDPWTDYLKDYMLELKFKKDYLVLAVLIKFFGSFVLKYNNQMGVVVYLIDIVLSSYSNMIIYLYLQD